MENKEFNLSEKIEDSPTFGSGKYQYMIYADDVKEFIRLLKENIHEEIGYEDTPQGWEAQEKAINERIDNLAGDKLT